MVKITNLIDKLPRHKTRRYRARKESRITHIVIHHSATRKGTPEQFARYHVGRGWPGIGYHYVIARNGVIYKTNPVLKTTYHCKGANSFSIGICVVGNFQEQKPSRKQLEALRGLIDELQWATARIGLEDGLEVLAHCDLSHTSCPGDHLYEWVKDNYK